MNRALFLKQRTEGIGNEQYTCWLYYDKNHEKPLVLCGPIGLPYRINPEPESLPTLVSCFLR